MDRVLSRRSYFSYNDDHHIIQPVVSQESSGLCIGNDVPFLKSMKSLRRDMNTISREAAESSTEMVRCIGEINKAKAALGTSSSIVKKA